MKLTIEEIPDPRTCQPYAFCKAVGDAPRQASTIFRLGATFRQGVNRVGRS